VSKDENPLAAAMREAAARQRAEQEARDAEVARRRAAQLEAERAERERKAAEAARRIADAAAADLERSRREAIEREQRRRNG
jgi:hypothetical protein